MSTHSQQPEVVRIEQAYARRKARGYDRAYTLADRANLLRLQQLQYRMVSLLPEGYRTELHNKQILEIGCGSGYWLREFIQWGALPENIVGVDLLPARIADARHLCPAGVRLEVQNATALSFPDSRFDLAFQATAFTSMLDPNMRVGVAAEMLRTLKPNGCILWYDFFVRNPWNPDVRAVSRREIHRLFPGCRIRLRRVTLAPPLGRTLSRLSSAAYRIVEATSLFHTHYVGIIEKTQTGRG
jgi:ubiquinone/menaquinone biosynthesis C-methylase UbiE